MITNAELRHEYECSHGCRKCKTLLAQKLYSNARMWTNDTFAWSVGKLILIRSFLYFRLFSLFMEHLKFGIFHYNPCCANCCYKLSQLLWKIDHHIGKSSTTPMFRMRSFFNTAPLRKQIRNTWLVLWKCRRNTPQDCQVQKCDTNF